MVVRVKAAVAFFANLTDRLSYAGRRAAGVVADFLVAVVADVIVICILVFGNGLAANIADMVFICIFMLAHISALTAHAVCPFVIFIRYAYGIAAVPFFLVGSGGLCPLFLASVIGGVGFAVRLAAMGANGFFGAGGSAAGVLRIAVFPRIIRHIAIIVGTLMPVMRCIGRPIGLPAMARGWNRLYFCCAALGAAICLFARFCAGMRCCYRTVVPSMRAYVILFIATGTLLPVLVIIMCPTGSKIMSQSIAIFRTANCAFCSLGAGGRAAGAVLCFHDIAGAAAAVFAVAVRCPVPIVGMFIALSLEHGQGYFCRSHILAAVPWRIVAASLEQLQHRAVSKLHGGFSCGICICVAQIVAVGGFVIAVDCDFINIVTTSDFADIIAVENLSGKIKTADTAGVATAVVYSAGDVADVIAIADYCHRT